MLKYIFGLVFIVLAWAAVFVFEELPLSLALGTTILVVVGLAAWVAIRWALERQAAARIELGLAGGGADAGLRPEVRAQIEAMQAEFHKAVSTLQSSKLARHGRSSLSALPWYVIIGPPGSGKSTRCAIPA